MNSVLPKDKTSGTISREARKLVHNSFQQNDGITTRKLVVTMGEIALLNSLKMNVTGTRRSRVRLRGQRLLNS